MGAAAEKGASKEATAEKASPDPEKDAAEEATAEMASPDPEKDAAQEEAMAAPLIPIADEEEEADEEDAASLTVGAEMAASDKVMSLLQTKLEPLIPLIPIPEEEQKADEEAAASLAASAGKAAAEKGASKEATAEMASPDPEKDAAEEAEP